VSGLGEIGALGGLHIDLDGVVADPDGSQLAVDRAAREDVLEAGEVVDELVVVPLGVEARRAAQVGQLRLAQVQFVLGPLLLDREGDRVQLPGHLAVGVDRVPEVDVEGIALRCHSRVHLEAVVERARRPGRRRGIRVTRDGETHVHGKC